MGVSVIVGVAVGVGVIVGVRVGVGVGVAVGVFVGAFVLVAEGSRVGVALGVARFGVAAAEQAAADRAMKIHTQSRVEKGGLIRSCPMPGHVPCLGIL